MPMSGRELMTLRLPVRLSTTELREQLINETDGIDCVQLQLIIEPQSVLISHTNVSFMLAKTKEFLNCWCL